MQALGGVLPRGRVAAHVLDGEGRFEPVEYGQQGAAQRARHLGEAGYVDQPGVAAGAHDEQPQHIGRGVDQGGRRRKCHGVRGRVGEQPGQDARLGLAAGDGAGQPGQVGAVAGSEELVEVVGVLRARRTGTGEEGAQLADGVGRTGGEVAAVGEDAQPVRQRTAGVGGRARRPGAQEGLIGVEAPVAHGAGGVVRTVEAHPAHQVRAR